MTCQDQLRRMMSPDFNDFCKTTCIRQHLKCQDESDNEIPDESKNVVLPLTRAEVSDTLFLIYDFSNPRFFDIERAYMYQQRTNDVTKFWSVTSCKAHSEFLFHHLQFSCELELGPDNFIDTSSYHLVFKLVYKRHQVICNLSSSCAYFSCLSLISCLGYMLLHRKDLFCILKHAYQICMNSAQIHIFRLN